MPKRIVISCDGTWNTPDQKDGGVIRPSNVVKMARAIAPLDHEGRPQVVFYDRGLGTHWGLDRITGGAFGAGISKNIEDAYRFIVSNYSEDDEIFFFGFSRGAYTVRSTAGLIRNSGLLHKLHAGLFPDALDLYRRQDVHPNDDEAREFRRKFSREVGIKFMGVWDTVGALGIPVKGLHLITKQKHEFHDVKLSRSIENAFHALAIDERRRSFKPTLWETQASEGQRVEQVWFAGVHTNVGGGYKDSGLSDIAFKWMKERAEECGLVFDERYIEATIEPNPHGTLRNSKKGIYRITKGHDRLIGRGTNPYESVHESAIKRREENDPPYNPPELEKYLERMREASAP